MSANWPIKRLGDLCEVVTKGTTPTSMGYAFVEEGINFIKVESIALNGSFITEKFAHITDDCHRAFRRSQLADGDILFSIAGALGRTAQVTEDILPANTNQALAIIRLKQGQLISRQFLVLALGTGLLLEQIEKSKGGVAQQNLSLAQVQDFQIPLPPLPEQRRIVGILDEAFAGIATAKANAEKNLQNARALFESHLHAVFTHRGPGWVESTIGQHILFIDYRGKTPVKTTSGIRLITAKNVKLGFLQEEPKEFIAIENYDSWMTRGFPKQGDVLFTTEAPLANVAQLDTDEKVAFAQRVIIMQPDRLKLDSTFLKYLLLSAPVQQRIREKGTGATVQGIKASLLKLIDITFPSDVAEQRRITARLDALQTETRRLEALYAKKLAALDELKASLLHQAFSGQL